MYNMYDLILIKLDCRWNMDEVDRLPEYMRTVYRFIMSTFEDYERDAPKLGKAFAIPYFIETVSTI